MMVRTRAMEKIIESREGKQPMRACKQLPKYANRKKRRVVRSNITDRDEALAEENFVRLRCLLEYYSEVPRVNGRKPRVSFIQCRQQASMTLLMRDLDVLNIIDGELQLPPIFKNSVLTIASLERLFPDRFLNDEIINFFAEYYTKVKYAQVSHLFLIYSTFFYQSILNMFTSTDQFDYRRVQRPRKENMFEKTFVVVPINLYEAHWVMLVICYPNLIKNFLHLISEVNQDADATAMQKRAVYFCDSPLGNLPELNIPCMLVLDSLISNRMSDSTIFNIVRKYLTEEFKRFYDIEVCFDSLHGYSQTCPQQDNESDCGIFTLQYIDVFLKNALPSDSNKPSSLEVDFPDDVMKLKRMKLLKIIVNYALEVNLDPVH